MLYAVARALKSLDKYLSVENAHQNFNPTEPLHVFEEVYLTFGSTATKRVYLTRMDLILNLSEKTG